MGATGCVHGFLVSIDICKHGPTLMNCYSKVFPAMGQTLRPVFKAENQTAISEKYYYYYYY